MKTYVCRRLRIKKWLEERGFEPYRQTQDEKNSDYVVWLFERTDKLTAALDLYFETNR